MPVVHATACHVPSSWQRRILCRPLFDGLSRAARARENGGGHSITLRVWAETIVEEYAQGFRARTWGGVKEEVSEKYKREDEDTR